MKKYKSAFTIFDHEWFHKNFVLGFLAKESQSKEFLNQPRFPISDESPSSRVLNHWNDVGILEDNRPDGKGWRKLSFTESVWIDIVTKLRKFGLDLKKIKLVKDCLDLHNGEDEVSVCPMLDFFILYSKASKHPVSLIVFASGIAFIALQKDIDFAKAVGTIDDDYISIDLSQLVRKRFLNVNLNVDYVNYSFTPIEKEVRKALYIDEVNSLSIKINGDSEFIIKKEHIHSSKEKIQSLLNEIGAYFEESKVVEGKKTYHKIVEKKKINK